MVSKLDKFRVGRYIVAMIITLLMVIAVFPSTVVPAPAHALTPTITPTGPGLIIRLHYKGWANPNLYAWVGTNTPLLGAWPGTPMVAEANGWYQHTIIGYSNVNLIFNGGGSQTPDLNRTIGDWWYYNNQWYNYNPEPTPTPTYTPTPTPTSIPVNFSLTISPTAGGEALLGSVYVVGSIPALGSWNPDLAIPLSTNPYPVWKTTVNIPANTYFEYKYIQKKTTGIVWDVDPNHRFTSPTSGNVTLNDIWGISNATPTPTPVSTVAVTFNVNATTVMGENVYIVGNVPALGAWNTAAAVPLNSAAYPTWRVTVNLPANTFIEYKYIKKYNSNITWESFVTNRSFTTPAGGTLTRNDSWNVWAARDAGVVAPTATHEAEMFDAIGLPTEQIR